MDKKIIDCDFDYSTREARENTICALFAYAKNSRATIEKRWAVFDSYYNRIREKILSLNEKASKMGLEDAKFHLTDPFIHIESQINTVVPEPRFRGRDGNLDSSKAKQRQYVVKSIIYKNDIDSKNTQNERAMRLYGDSFMKCYYDANKEYNDEITGDICLDLINVDDLFPDPNANSLDECEYIDYVYYMHKRKAVRVWGDKLKKAGIDLDELGGDSRDSQVVSDGMSSAIMPFDVRITEHWYIDKEGDICCSMMLNDKEFHHIEKYWDKTKVQNKLFPFVQFYRLKSMAGFWNISEIEAIIPLCDIVDRMLNAALDNIDLMSNDVTVVEEDALAENCELTNEPGAVIKVKAGRVNAVKRLGGLNALKDMIGNIQYIQGEIQRTLRNYDSNTGKETARVTTASGLAQLRADASQQTGIKDYDRMQAWKRLFKLIDWTALEFYDDDRLIFIGTPNSNEIENSDMSENLDPKQGNIFFRFNSKNVRKAKNERIEGINKGLIKVSNDGYYYPSIDCEINASDGIEKSKSFTIQVLQSLISTQITIDNYKIASKLIEELDIPQKDDIIDMWADIFEPKPIEGMDEQTQAFLSKLPPQQQALFRKRPDLLELAINNAFQQDNNFAGNSAKIQ